MKENIIMENRYQDCYERGLKAGQWTKEQVKNCGFQTPEECLQHQEKVHVEDLQSMERLRAQNPAFAERQEVYLKGVIEGTRASLQQLIREQGKEQR
jgi:hypothetical protein